MLVLISSLISKRLYIYTETLYECFLLYNMRWWYCEWENLVWSIFHKYRCGQRYFISISVFAQFYKWFLSSELFISRTFFSTCPAQSFINKKANKCFIFNLFTVGLHRVPIRMFMQMPNVLKIWNNECMNRTYSQLSRAVQTDFHPYAKWIFRNCSLDLKKWMTYLLGERVRIVGDTRPRLRHHT